MATDEQISEQHRKIYKDMKPLAKDDFSNPTKSQKTDIKKLEAKDGKIILNKEERIPPFTTYKYSKNGKGDLYESVLIGGQPCFLTYNHTTSKLNLCPGISEKFRILYAAEPSDYQFHLTNLKAKKKLN